MTDRDPMSSSSPPRVSLAMPVFDEERLVGDLVSRCRAVLRETPGGPHEIVVVDDGSRDRTRERLDALAAEVTDPGDAELVVVSLSRNFGHQVAMSAALAHATGDAVLAMDGDLQDPPEMLPHFLERFHQGYDVVYALRRQRKESWILRACYYLFYRLIAALSDLRLPLDSGDFALMSRRVVDAMVGAPEHHRYLRGLRTWVGYPQSGLEVERHARAAGESKYSILRLMRLAFDGIFAFSVVPLRAATLLGLSAVGLSVLYGLYAVVAKLLFDASPQGFTTLLLVVVFLSGMQMLFLGVVGEYVGRIYEEVKRRPHYLVDRVVRSSSPSHASALQAGGDSAPDGST